MRIWFNRGFSLAPVSAAMIAAEPTLEVFVGIGKGMPCHPGPTATWIEPDSAQPDYVDWARSQIVEHDIDVFIPTRHRRLLVEAELPCRVDVPATPEVLSVVEDKYAFAEAVRDEDFWLPTVAVDSCESLRAALADFAEVHGDTVVPCVKPRHGVNGHGFWKLTQRRPMSHLISPDNRDIMSDLYLAALERQEAERAIDPLVLMEYLPGPEISFDVLAHHGVPLRRVARTKLADGRQRVQSEHELKGAVDRLVRRFALHGVVNIQFRRARDGTWKVLEINPRPAGGSVYAEPYGAGILAGWAGLLTGRLTPDSVDQTPIDIEIAFTQVIAPVMAGGAR